MIASNTHFFLFQKTQSFRNRKFIIPIKMICQPWLKNNHKEELPKVAFWSYLNKHNFGPEFKIFRFYLKIHMLMSWKRTSNNSYRLFNNSRLPVYLNPQRGIWKWLIKLTTNFVVFVFRSLAVVFLVGSILLSNSKWWMVYKNYCSSITD